MIITIKTRLPRVRKPVTRSAQFARKGDRRQGTRAARARRAMEG